MSQSWFSLPHVAAPNLDQTPGVILQFADRTIGACNTEAEEILGYPAGHLIGQPGFGASWQCRQVDESRLRLDTCPIETAWQTGQPFQDMVFDFCRPDGEWVSLHVNAQPLFQAPNPSPYAVVITLWAISFPTAKATLGDAGQVVHDLILDESIILPDQTQLLLALQAAGMIAWHIDLMTQEVTFSDHPEATFDFPPGSFGHTLDDMFSLVHPDDLGRAAELVEQAIAGEQPYDLEFRLLHPDGRAIWVQDVGKVLRDATGQATSFLGISQNITQRKKDEELLRETQEFKRRVLESSRDCIKVLDLEGRLLYMNPGGMDLMEIETCDQFLNMEWLSLWGAAEQPKAQIALDTAKAGGTGYFEGYCPTAKGTPKWWDVVITPIKDTQDTVIQLLSISRDMTDRKQAESRLAQQEQKYHDIFEAVGVSIWEEDFSDVKRVLERLKAQGIQDFRQYFTDHLALAQELLSLVRVVDVNEASLQLFGAANKQDLLTALDQIFLPETLPIFVEELVALAENHPRFEAETVLQTLQGQRLHVLFSITFPRSPTTYEKALVSIVDISDRQQSEQRLRDSEERLKLGVQVAELGLARVDYPSNRVELSPEAAYLFGIPGTDLVVTREHIHATFHPEERDELLQIIAQVLDPKGAGWFAREHRVVWPTGEVRWLSVRKQVFFNRLAVVPYPTHAMLAALDVTERKRTEADLRASEERFRTMADHAPVMIWVTDTTGFCTYLSQSWYDFTGQTTAQSLGFGWLDAIHPDDYEMARAAFLTANANQTDFHVEYRLRRHDGEYRWAIDAASPWLGAAGEFQGFIGSVLDITERKQAEEALRHSEERYRTLFESMEDGFCIIQMIFDETDTPIDYRFIEINPSFEHQTGLHKALGKTARQMLPNLENHWFEIYGNVALTGQSLRFENGSDVMNRWFDVYAFRVGNPNSRKVGLLFKDISDRKQAEVERDRLLQQTEAAREAAETANRMKDEFLTVLSHELRTPLSPILGWAKMLQTKEFAPHKVKEALATIERNAKLQVQLIDDLLDISKILRGKLSLNLAPVSLVNCIQQAMETVRLAADAKAIDLQFAIAVSDRVSSNSFNPPPASDFQIMGDEGRLQQVIWNLLSNAVKFTPRQGQVQVQLTLIADGNVAQIIVRDTGRGISPEFLPYIFDAFRQQDSSTTRRFGGLGLGLTIVRQLVEAHGGTIMANSRGEEQGSIFTIQLPLTPNAVCSIAPSRAQQQDNLKDIRVLLVDDEPDTLELLKVVLESKGAITTPVETAAAALQLLESIQFDVLISDIGMPHTDGYDLIRTLRSKPTINQSIHAIALTAYAGRTDEQKAINAGFQQHVAKPLDPPQVIDVLKAWVQANRAS